MGIYKIQKGLPTRSVSSAVMVLPTSVTGKIKTCYINMAKQKKSYLKDDTEMHYFKKGLEKFLSDKFTLVNKGK